MTLKFSILWTLLVIAGLTARGQAQKPTTVAVLNVSGPHKTLAKNISSLLTANLSADERFVLVDRTELDKVLGEQALGSSGTINRETAAKIGQLTGARVLVTGREFTQNGLKNVVVVANVIGTETGKVFSHTGQGSRSNLVAFVSEMSEQIARIISEQTTNLVAHAVDQRERLLDKVIAETRGKKLPSVSIRIEENNDGSARTAETELALVFQKAGFTVVDAKSTQPPDVVITGDAVAGDPEKRGDLVSCPATISIKARDRASGKVLSLDLQQSTAVGVGERPTVQQACQNAADELAERLVPLLAK